jgi:hypothetical protein
MKVLYELDGWNTFFKRFADRLLSKLYEDSSVGVCGYQVSWHFVVFHQNTKISDLREECDPGRNDEYRIDVRSSWEITQFPTALYCFKY